MKFFIIYFCILFNLFSQIINENHYGKETFAPYKNFDEEKYSYENLDSILQGYKSNYSNEIFLKAIADNNSIANYYQIGKTRLGYTIPALLITNNNLIRKPAILFNCSHHSDELISTEFCYDVIYDLINNQKDYVDILNKINIWIVPIVNPDGSYFFWNKSVKMGRKNGFLHSSQKEDSLYRGIDLNRNYSFKWNSGHITASSSNPNHSFYRGEKPFSEPESQAMSILAEQERFVYSISYHSFASKILFPYTIENIKNPNIDFPKYLSDKLYKITKMYKIVKNLYPVDGTDQDYYYFKYGTIALLIESSHKNIKYKDVKEVVKNINPIWKEIINEFINGEKIFIKVVDENFNNIEARIEIDEFIYYNNEVFTSNALTGFYLKPVIEKKEYILKISHPMFETKKIILKSSNNFEPEIIILKK
jgi:hypothetical protein